MNDAQRENDPASEKDTTSSRIGRLLGRVARFLETRHEPAVTAERFTFDATANGVSTVDIYRFGSGGSCPRAWLAAASPDESVLVEYTSPDTGLRRYTVREYGGMYQDPSDEYDPAARHWMVEQKPDGSFDQAVRKRGEPLTAVDQSTTHVVLGSHRRVWRVSRANGPVTDQTDVPITSPAIDQHAQEAILTTISGIEDAVAHARLDELDADS